MMIEGRSAAVGADAAAERIAAERAEADHLFARRLARLEAEAVVVDHDQRAAALDHRTLAREIERHDLDAFGVDVGPDVELGPVARAGRRACSRPARGGC